MLSPLYTTAPSTPKSSAADDLFTADEFSESFSTVPFQWENKPGLPKPLFPANHDDDEDDNDDGFTFNTSCNEVTIKEEVYSRDHVKTEGTTLKPPPPMPLGELSFSRKGAIKRSVWGGRRSCSCDFNVDFDPFEAALEKVVEESVVVTPLRDDHGSKWRVKKLLTFPRSSLSDRKNDDRFSGSSLSSTCSNADLSSGSLSSAVQPEARLGRGSADKSEKTMRAYKYNKWLVGCLGFHRGKGGVHKFVKDIVALSP